MVPGSHTGVNCHGEFVNDRAEKPLKLSRLDAAIEVQRPI